MEESVTRYSSESFGAQDSSVRQHFIFASYHVCACVFSSHLLAAVPLFKARRALHFGVCLEDYIHLFSVFCYPTRTNRGHTGGGKHRGFILLFILLLCPTVLLRCLPSFFIARRVRPSLSLVNTTVEFCLLAKISSYKSLSTTRYESERKPTLAEIRTRDLVARSLLGYQLDHRGDRFVIIHNTQSSEALEYDLYHITLEVYDQKILF